MARSSPRPNAALRCLCAVLALSGAVAAFADPILPPSQFLYDVVNGANHACPASKHFSANGGTCSYAQGSKSGFAETSGGVGSPSYDPSLGKGTAVLSTASAPGRNLAAWANQGSTTIRSVATMIYSFAATGPAGINYIPVDLLSSAIIAATGSGTAFVSLSVTEGSSDANIPPGYQDPDPAGALLTLSSHDCHNGHCTSDWTSAQRTDTLCLVAGDNYEITITAVSTAGAGGRSGTSSALLDPYLKPSGIHLLAPLAQSRLPSHHGQSPPSPCRPITDLSLFGVDTGLGSSTGYASVPEPGTLGLAAFALLVLGVAVRYRRSRRRPPND